MVFLKGNEVSGNIENELDRIQQVTDKYHMKPESMHKRLSADRMCVKSITLLLVLGCVTTQRQIIRAYISVAIYRFFMHTLTFHFITYLPNLMLSGFIDSFRYFVSAQGFHCFL